VTRPTRIEPATPVGLLQACDDTRLLGITLTPKQRELLAAVEAGSLIHVWALGRRSGKTLMAAIVALWFCLLRPDLARHVRPGERRYCVAVATNARQARLFVGAARSIVEQSRLLAPLIESVTDDEILFRNGTALAAFPCTSRGGRGWPIAALLLDETAHMLDGDGNQAADSVYRAFVPSVAQFGEQARVIVASSPYGTDGLFADLYRKAAAGELPGAVAQHASTAEANPAIPAEFLAAEEARDPDSFRSEYLAEFVQGGGAYLDWRRVVAAVDESRFELPPGEVLSPVAAVDLAFVRDASALAIVGRDRRDRERLRLVLVRQWKPDGAALGFTPLLDEIADVCRLHGVSRVLTDQFCSAPAVEHLQRRGLSASQVTTTPQSKSGMFAALKTRLYSGQLELYRHEVLLGELGRLETNTTVGASTVRIRRLGSSHGDVATAVALACSEIRGSGLATVHRATGQIGDAPRRRRSRAGRIDRYTRGGR
jgi:hypothetical protein